MAGLNLDITANANDVLKELGRVRGEIGKLGDQQQRQAERSKSFAKDAIGGFALLAGAKAAIAQSDEAERAEHKMAAAIEATGNAAHVTADEQRKLSDELAKKLALDNDDIMVAANRLRAYKQITDEKFGETLAASLDLAAAKEMDLTAATDLLGKALNDPVAGIAKLKRQGVLLTEQQQEQIKAMSAAGDVAGAQGIILDELSKKYAGAAEANVTGSQRAKVALDDLAESVGRSIAPALEVAATGVGKLAEGFGELPQPVQTATVLLGAGAAAVDKLRDRLDGTSISLGSTVSEVGKLNAALAGVVTGVGSFAATTQILNSLTDSGADVSDLTKDLTDFANGLIGPDEAVGELTGSVDGLVEAFKRGTDVSFGNITGDLGAEAFRIHHAQSEIDKLDKTLAAMVEAGHVDEANAAFMALREELRKGGVDSNRITSGLNDYFDAVERAGRATKDAAPKIQAAADADRTWYGVNKDQAQAFRDRLTLLRDINTETDKAQDSIIGAANAQTGYESSVMAAQQAAADLAEAWKKGDPKEIARAELALTEAINRQAAAARDNAEAQAKAEGRTFDAGQAAVVLRGEYDKARKATKFWNDTLATTVARLDYVSAERKIHLDTDGAEARLKRMRDYAVEIDRVLNGLDNGKGQVTAPTRDPDAGPRSMPGGTKNVARGSRSLGGVTITGDVKIGGIDGVRDLQMWSAAQDHKHAREILRSTS